MLMLPVSWGLTYTVCVCVCVCACVCVSVRCTCLCTSHYVKVFKLLIIDYWWFFFFFAYFLFYTKFQSACQILLKDIEFNYGFSP